MSNRKGGKAPGPDRSGPERAPVGRDGSDEGAEGVEEPGKGPADPEQEAGLNEKPLLTGEIDVTRGVCVLAAVVVVEWT